MRFPSAIDALSFSEEVLEKATGNEGQFARILRGPPGAGEYTLQDLRDIALSISVLVDQIEPLVYAHLLRTIYGREHPRTEAQVWDWLVGKVKGMEGMKHRDPQLLLRLAYTVLRGHRRFLLMNKPMPMTTIAAAVGVRRQKLKEEGWVTAVSVMRRAIGDGVDIGTRQLDSILRDRDLLS